MSREIRPTFSVLRRGRSLSSGRSGWCHRVADVRGLQALAAFRENPPRRVMFRVRSSLAQDFEQIVFAPSGWGRVARAISGSLLTVWFFMSQC